MRKKWTAMLAIPVLIFVWGCGGGSDDGNKEPSPEAVAEMTACIEDSGESEKRRWRVARKLARSKSEQAMQSLLKVASREDESVELRLECIRALVVQCHPGAAEGMAALAEAPELRIREAAIQELWRWKGEATTAALRKALGDAEASVRRAALDGLRRTGVKLTPAELETLLADKEVEIASSAAEMVLARIDEKGCAALVQKMLDSGVVRLRELGAQAAATGRMKDLTPTLRKLLEDESPLVRAAAAAALAALEDKEAADAVANLLYEPDTDVVVAAAEALRKIGGPKQAGPLTKVLQNRSIDAAARDAALDACVALGIRTKEFFEALEWMARFEADSELQKKAQKTLKELKAKE